ncbi:putative RND-type efflux pump outer membrane protein [Flavihumibacter petaseus NBRC 106054]|uniref:Putative RND-type efflux pump outer membrane protein n=2 Tax=Flavihumibacter TaxID=1004301 RepID=A0A0E9N8J9_9BACT|nr:putative RND-type efflux pump outer membrane protein [Flavihumibacter petaseus NBRC 106054]
MGYNRLLAQTANDSVLITPDLQQCIQYALKHQPTSQQATIDEKIIEYEIRSKLADWYPQVNLNYNLQHNFQVQTSIIGGNPIKLGVDNISALQFGLSQQIFNRDVLLAARTQDVVRLQARQNTAATRIDVAANVSKAFYDVLATRQQIEVSQENIVRISRSLQDATNQYKAGVADKTDYKRAIISLNNSKAFLKSSQESLKAKEEYLKYLMGYPVTQQLDIVFDSLQMEREIQMDTLLIPDLKNRIEYKQLETRQRLLEASLKYERWGFLPSVALNGNYNMNFLNESLGKLYHTNYPNSFANLTLAFPIFQGGKRIAQIRSAEWELKRGELDIIDLGNSVNSQYAQAIAAYKSNYANYVSLRENLLLSQEVYDVIQLQYRSGVKTYLEVIVAQTDLRTSQLTYYNALYDLLAAKIDLQRSLGLLIY